MWRPVLVPPPLCSPQPSPLSLFLAHYLLHQQTSPWAAVKRTVLSHSDRQPQSERCPALLILINTHTHTRAQTHAHSPQRAPLTDMLVGSRFFFWPSRANETSSPLEKQARDRILEKFYWEETLFSLYGLIWVRDCGRRRMCLVPLGCVVFPSRYFKMNFKNKTSAVYLFGQYIIRVYTKIPLPQTF